MLFSIETPEADFPVARRHIAQKQSPYVKFLSVQSNNNKTMALRWSRIHSVCASVAKPHMHSKSLIRTNYQQDGQCTYNVAFWRIRVMFIPPQLF